MKYLFINDNKNYNLFRIYNIQIIKHKSFNIHLACQIAKNRLQWYLNISSISFRWLFSLNFLNFIS